jgi:hypothetical protein
MLIFLWGCLEPNGTVVGNPGTTSLTHQARVKIAESEGFTYNEANITFEHIDYFDAGGLVARQNIDETFEPLSSSSTFTLRDGVYNKIEISLSEPKPIFISYSHEDLGSANLELPIDQIVFEKENITISGQTVLQIGSRNWLRADTLHNEDLLKGLLEYSSDIYSDENDNGEIEEEEEATPITTPDEDVEYEIQGTWYAENWFPNQNRIHTNVVLNISPEGYLFEAEQTINQETRSVYRRILKKVPHHRRGCFRSGCRDGCSGHGLLACCW